MKRAYTIPTGFCGRRGCRLPSVMTWSCGNGGRSASTSQLSRRCMTKSGSSTRLLPATTARPWSSNSRAIGSADRIKKNPVETRAPSEHRLGSRRNRPHRKPRIVGSIEHLQMIQLLIETQTHHRRAICNNPQRPRRPAGPSWRSAVRSETHGDLSRRSSLCSSGPRIATCCVQTGRDPRSSMRCKSLPSMMTRDANAPNLDSLQNQRMTRPGRCMPCSTPASVVLEL